MLIRAIANGYFASLMKNKKQKIHSSYIYFPVFVFYVFVNTNEINYMREMRDNTCILFLKFLDRERLLYYIYNIYREKILKGLISIQ